MELTLSLTLDNGAIQLFWTYFIRFCGFVNGIPLDRLHEMSNSPIKFDSMSSVKRFLLTLSFRAGVHTGSE